MRVVYLAAGAGGFYCGACARDVALARGLKARGHDCLLLPLYTPLEVDGPDPSARRVFYGGLSAYLEQKSAVFRHKLPLVDRLLDSRRLLRTISRLAIETRPEELGEMTVSVLRGPTGRQAKELAKLITFLQAQAQPDLINLTNSMLSAVVGPLKERFGVPVICTLQGEEAFIDRLAPADRDVAWTLLREHAARIDLFISPSSDYADEMSQRLTVPRERFRVVRPGVDTELYRPAAQASAGGPLRIGCLGRLAPLKGTDLLCAAYARVHSAGPGRTRLALAGQVAAADRPWLNGVQEQMAGQGLAAQVEFRFDLTLAEKVEFLQGLSLFVQASRFAERRGMAAAEALACGVPIVVPRSGIFPEMVELTGGGMVVEPENAEALAEALGRLAADTGQRTRFSRAARAGAEQYFSAEVMTATTLSAYRELLAGGAAK